MSKFTKHLALGEKIIINEEEFILKPLSIEYLPEFFSAMKSFSGLANKKGEDIDPSEFFKSMDREGSSAIAKIIDETLRLSYPDESAEERKAFGLKYMGELMNKIFEINSSNINNAEVQARLKALKKNEHT